MLFPKVSDIMVHNVLKISRKETLEAAMTTMYESDHRNIIIEDKENYYILTSSDVISYKLKNYDLKSSLESLTLKKLDLVDANKNILQTLPLLQHSLEYIGVVDGSGHFVGLLTHTDIMNSINPSTLIENLKISDFIKLSKRIKWVEKTQPIIDILQDMTNDTYSSAIVIEDKKPIGIITTKDAIRIFKDECDLSLPIENYMHAPVDTVNESISLQEAIEYMQKHTYKRIVAVNDAGELVAVINQKELISLTYSKWATLMQDYQKELQEINTILESEKQKYEALASVDPLTGLYNRSKFYDLFLSAYKLQQQRESAMSLMMLDIDHFKRINDTFGHNIGDKVLVGIATILRNELRNIDIICRWGGEEFVVLLPTATLDNAQKIAQKIRLAIQKSKIIEEYTITASFGLTAIGKGDTLEGAVERADQALYRSKESGRNQVTLN